MPSAGALPRTQSRSLLQGTQKMLLASKRLASLPSNDHFCESHACAHAHHKASLICGHGLPHLEACCTVVGTEVST